MRKNYIDNLRSFVILLLFPFHTCRMFTENEANYIQGHTYLINDIFCYVVWIWFMNLLFVLAGMSAFYSLRKRSLFQFYSERVKKVFIPFLFGLILTAPIQTYYAEKWHNGYEGSYLSQYKLFFTKIDDFTGYFGGFTPAHLWFLLFLFLISLAAYPCLRYMKKNGAKKENNDVSMLQILPLFLVFWATSALDIGKPIGSEFCYFVAGLILFSRDVVLQKLQRFRKPLFAAAIVTIATSVISAYCLDWGDRFSVWNLTLSAYQNLAAWLMILALIGMGQSYMNSTNRFLQYMRKNSFSIYFVHQTLLVVLAYYIILNVQGTLLQYVLIMTGGFVCSILSVEMLKRIPIVNEMFGMRH